MLIKGRCHCGNMVFELEWGGDPLEIPARACGCSFCVKHGGVWTSNPKSRKSFRTRIAIFAQSSFAIASVRLVGAVLI